MKKCGRKTKSGRKCKNGLNCRLHNNLMSLPVTQTGKGIPLIEPDNYAQKKAEYRSRIKKADLAGRKYLISAHSDIPNKPKKPKVYTSTKQKCH